LDRTSSSFDRSARSAHPRARRGGAVHPARFTSGQLLWAKPARSRDRVTAKQARCRPWHWASSTDARSQPRWLGSEALGLDVVARSSERANCSLGCPAAVGCSRLSAGNTHGSLLVDRHCGWSRPCRPWTVNPSRKLRRFESFTCHHVRERASDLRKRGSEALFIYLWGVSKRRRFGDPQSFPSQACDLRKRVNRIGWR
jgi:hypothetical protein